MTNGTTYFNNDKSLGVTGLEREGNEENSCMAQEIKVMFPFQNSHRGYRGTSFLLHLLRFMGLLISVALFLCNLHHLQKDSGNRLVELDFGLGLEQHLEALYLFISPLVIAGLALLLLSIFGSGKEILLVSVIVFIF